MLDHAAEVERAGADLVRAIGVPQRDAVLAADPRPVIVQAAARLVVERGAGHAAIGLPCMGAREDVVAHRGRQRREALAQQLALERRHAEALVAAVAAAGSAADVLAPARDHRRDAVVDEAQVTAQALATSGIHGRPQWTCTTGSNSHLAS
ncbi:MAG: hypothetical protein U0168_04510 [Nannocystaceae bacterium]